MHDVLHAVCYPTSYCPDRIPFWQPSCPKRLHLRRVYLVIPVHESVQVAFDDGARRDNVTADSPNVGRTSGVAGLVFIPEVEMNPSPRLHDGLDERALFHEELPRWPLVVEVKNCSSVCH